MGEGWVLNNKMGGVQLGFDGRGVHNSQIPE